MHCYYEVILLYEESVGIDKWVKSYGDRYSMAVMIIFMCKEFILIVIISKDWI